MKPCCGSVAQGQSLAAVEVVLVLHKVLDMSWQPYKKNTHMDQLLSERVKLLCRRSLGYHKEQTLNNIFFLGICKKGQHGANSP